MNTRLLIDCRMIAWGVACALVLVCSLSAPSTQARTIILDGSQLDRVAGLDAQAPRYSMPLGVVWGTTRMNSSVNLAQGRSAMFRFDMGEIPENHRIAYAELILHVSSFSGNEPRFYLWRAVADWGVGVCHDYRKIEGDQKLPWTRAGAAGISTDRATRPTDVIRLTESGEVVINVTEDVELWYRGEAENNGWLLSVEDPGVAVALPSPVWQGAAQWRLRITYEPE